MKKYILALSLAALTAVPQLSMAQTKPATTITVAVTDSLPADEVEAYSDTTGVANDADSTVTAVTSSSKSYSYHFDADDDDFVDMMFKLWNEPDARGALAGGIIVLGILFILFVLAPLAVLGLLLFFIYKNRKQKMRLAEEAMKHGQPIPDQLFTEQKALPEKSDLRTRGIRQTCLGVGLMIFLGNTAGEIGFGVGALVTAIGVGNLLIARKEQ